MTKDYCPECNFSGPHPDCDLHALPPGMLHESPPLLVPEGWKLVPVEPTEAMLDAVTGVEDCPASIYAAMLAAVGAL